MHLLRCCVRCTHQQSIKQYRFSCLLPQETYLLHFGEWEAALGVLAEGAPEQEGGGLLELLGQPSMAHALPRPLLHGRARSPEPQLYGGESSAMGSFDSGKGCPSRLGRQVHSGCCRWGGGVVAGGDACAPAHAHIRARTQAPRPCLHTRAALLPRTPQARHEQRGARAPCQDRGPGTPQHQWRHPRAATPAAGQLSHGPAPAAAQHGQQRHVTHGQPRRHVY